MAQMESREVFNLLASVSKKSPNKMTLKLTVLIMDTRPWESKEGKKMYTYTSYASSVSGLIIFNSSRLLPNGKEAEVVLTLSGFSAFEAFK